MPDPTDTILAYLRQVSAGIDSDFLREAVRVMSALLIEIEVKQQIDADRYERTTYRNGYRDRAWQTRVGEILLKVPELREGSYFPSLLDPRRQAEQALLSVIQQAYIQGVSTRLPMLMGPGIRSGPLQRQTTCWWDRALDGIADYKQGLESAEAEVDC